MLLLLLLLLLQLIIIMVGLPGRGKTFLCNKLKCYLNW
jgi:6-phosphofructo-2-kinase/fructose-2,6-biphosphatase